MIGALILISVLGVSFAFAAIPSNYNAGIATGNNASITKTITMASEREIAFILKKASGNFNNEAFVVSVSADNSTFYQIDSIQAGVSTTKVIQYSTNNLGTGLAINPSIFPFLKFTFPQIINNTVVITWSSVRG